MTHHGQLLENKQQLFLVNRDYGKSEVSFSSSGQRNFAFSLEAFSHLSSSLHIKVLSPRHDLSSRITTFQGGKWFHFSSFCISVSQENFNVVTQSDTLKSNLPLSHLSLRLLQMLRIWSWALSSAICPTHSHSLTAGFLETRWTLQLPTASLFLDQSLTPPPPLGWGMYSWQQIHLLAI